MVKALVGAYVAMVLSLCAAAVMMIWRLRCEGFGCMGVAAVWLVWVAAFFAVLGVGVFARTKAAAAGGMARAGNIAWWLQLAVGAVVVTAWASATLA